MSDSTPATPATNWAQAPSFSDLFMFSIKFIFAFALAATVIAAPIALVWGAIEATNLNTQAAMRQKQQPEVNAYYQQLLSDCRSDRQYCKIEATSRCEKVYSFEQCLDAQLGLKP